MPMRKGWVIDVAENLYWAILDYCEPEIARRFHCDIHNGFVHVYCEGHMPSAVLELLDDKFFKEHGIARELWEPMFRFAWSNSRWEPYSPAKHANLPGVLFGWRYRQSVLFETNKDSRKAEAGEVSLEDSQCARIADEPEETVAYAQPGRPAFQRRIMD